MKKRMAMRAVLTGVLAGGSAYWFMPYNQMAVFDINIFLIMGTVSFLFSLLLMYFQNEKPAKIALFVTLGVNIAVLARIVYDTVFWDSTSHNLAPVEFLLSSIVTLPSAFAGVFLGLFIIKQKK